MSLIVKESIVVKTARNVLLVPCSMFSSTTPVGTVPRSSIKVLVLYSSMY